MKSSLLDAVEDRELVKEFTSAKKIPVIELFGPTIQGEGPLVGSRTLFIRFGGCDYRCGKCDSPHAVIPAAVKKHARKLTAKQIADETITLAKTTNTDWVTLSGGNPCMWDLTKLIEDLHASGLFVAVETQGTLAPKWLNICDMVVVSPKAPGMQENFVRNTFQEFMSSIDNSVPVALKVVVFSALDCEYALTFASIADEIRPSVKYLSLGNSYPPDLDGELDMHDAVTPAPHKDILLRDYKTLLEDVLQDKRLTQWRFLPQLHVLVWGNEGER